MAVGQRVLSAAVLDVAELDRLGARIEDRERRRSTGYAEQLVDALARTASTPPPEWGWRPMPT